MQIIGITTDLLKHILLQLNLSEASKRKPRLKKQLMKWRLKTMDNAFQIRDDYHADNILEEISRLKKERSEERRVGKEYRSRWKTTVRKTNGHIGENKC